jgi:membrane protein implicated in regulation of membrane protease activity
VALLRIALLAIGSMFWPLLLVVVVIALETSHPTRILVWFYLGGFVTAVSVGAALVFVLQGSALMTGSRLPEGPWVDIVLGVAALVIGLACGRTYLRRKLRRAQGETPKESRGKGRLQRLVENGGPLAFAGGVVGSVFPGPLVIVGMAEVAQLDYPTVATLVVILVFFVIVFAFIEVPLAGFVIAPEATKAVSVTAKGWLDRNLLLLAAWALTIVGAFQIVRGIVVLLR